MIRVAFVKHVTVTKGDEWFPAWVVRDDRGRYLTVRPEHVHASNGSYWMWFHQAVANA